jgi:hypothetical protein
LLNLKDWSENGIMEEKIMICFVHPFKAMAASEKLTNRLPPLSPTTQLHKKIEIFMFLPLQNPHATSMSRAFTDNTETLSLLQSLH